LNSFSLEVYSAIARVNDLALSPDGGRLILTIQTLSPDSTRYVTSLWEMPADGSTEARRLTFSEKGESSPAFLPDGSLIFTSARSDPTVKDDETEGRVWCLPAAGGEARRVLSFPGPVDGVATARRADTIALKAQLFPGATSLEADAEKAKQRKQAGTNAILHDDYPIRYWDHDLGARQARLLLSSAMDGGEPKDLLPDPGKGLSEAEFALSPDGQTLVTTFWRPAANAFHDVVLLAFDGTGCRTLTTSGDYASPAVSPDGCWVAAIKQTRGNPERATDVTLWLVDLQTGEGHDLLPGFDLWPNTPVWSADGRAVYFTADERGHAPVFRVDAESGELTKIAGEGCFTALCPAPDGSKVFALRSSYRSPNEIVSISADGSVSTLPTPGLPLDLPGEVTEVTCTADDGQALRAWLVLPKTASPERPTPLVLWVHGGPLASWNGWSWRWCPHLLAERGFAVLLPDPALSTGYGNAFIQRAWGSWGERAYTDVIALTDAALQRSDLDASRTAAMGGSFGGYMTNWIAGHTDRFRAIVTHAGIWALQQQQATSDIGPMREYQMGDPYVDPSRWIENSPHRHIGSIRTPMLVIHGLQDYRVPIAHALHLWTDLQRHAVPSQYLFFPDENHWILKPGNTRAWYEAVLAFLDHHVLGEQYRRPELL
jgi:dipeptidyl aminopeptidase/acylaminoacyl peptidase